MPRLVATAGADAGERHQVACYFPARFTGGTRSVSGDPFREALPEAQS